MPIKLIHKSLASINEKTFFYINFSSIVTQQKNKNNFSISTLYFELISILVNAGMYFNHGFDFNFFVLAHDTIVNIGEVKIGKVRQASKSMMGILRRS